MLRMGFLVPASTNTWFLRLYEAVSLHYKISELRCVWFNFFNDVKIRRAKRSHVAFEDALAVDDDDASTMTKKVYVSISGRDNRAMRISVIRRIDRKRIDHYMPKMYSD